LICEKGKECAIFERAPSPSQSSMVDHGIHPNTLAELLNLPMDDWGADGSSDGAEVAMEFVKDPPQPFPVP
jgi:hypothetical protein